MTYSIVARDPDTGLLGVAVQTSYFGVGAIVPWAEAGVGAVATQSFTEVSYGPVGLDRMRAGASAPDALSALLAADEEEAMRQVAMVDATGTVAAHTGSGCVPACGSSQGHQVSTRANMMERDTVWEAMLEAYGQASGDLPDRLIASLQAAEREGGDIRGRQSAALLVVEAERPENPWEGRLVDVRVEDHPAPVTELARLATLARAFRHAGRGNDLAKSGELEQAAAEYDRAAELAPESDQIAFWRGLILVGAGRPVEGRAELERARAANPRYATYLRRLPAAGLFPDDPALFGAMLPLDPESGA